MDFNGTAVPLSEGGLHQAVDLLGVGPAELWTVLSVETRGCGYLSDRRAVILFERHIFHQQTSGAFDAANPSISSRTPGGYLGGTREYERLQQAVALNSRAALNSASWGIGQIMGFNSALAGFESVEAMVAAVAAGEDGQLVGTARFLCAQHLNAPLASHDWPTFARGYNGPDFSKNQYAERLDAAFRTFSHGPLPSVAVRQAQMLLMFLGIDAGTIDGIAGKRTRSAVVQFRALHELGDSEEIDAPLIAALTKSVGQLTG